MMPHKLILIPILLVCFGLAPLAQAVNPPPDGGYPGFNTAEGQNALAPAVPGVWNTAIGGFTLANDQPGANGNTAVGLNALRYNTTGTFNTAVGLNATLYNQTGRENIAIGAYALNLNTTATRNTGVGFQTLLANNADDNTAVGWKALFNNTGDRNCAFGAQALFKNTTSGDGSNAFGFQALYHQTTGLFNNGFGWHALFSNQTGSNNTAIGDVAGSGITGSGNVCIGASVFGQAGVNDSTYIRNVFDTSQPHIVGVNDLVTVRSDGRLGFTLAVAPSSQRYKQDIKSMDQSSEVLFRLKPVTFRYNKDLDPTEGQHWGLVAEDVEKVNPDLVVRNREGQIESVRYDEVNAMLLNEFLKEHRKVEAQQATIAEQQASVAELKSTVAQQQKGMEILTAQLKEQAAQIQKVSAQLEASKPAPRTVLNNQ
jgi:hypothetical protein